MYKVISKATGERLTVDAVDVSKHLHISGTEFTPEALASVTTVSAKKSAPVVEDVEEAPKAKKGK